MSSFRSDAAELVGVVARHTNLGDGRHSTAVEGLVLHRSSVTTTPTPAVYPPSLCVIASGAKDVLVGDAILSYDTASYLVSSVNVPARGAVTLASPGAPYLCVQVELDMGLVATTMIELGLGPTDEPAAALRTYETCEQLLDVVVRLVRLLDSQQDAWFLASLYRRELVYRLLTGAASSTLCGFAAPRGQTVGLLNALRWLRTNFTEPVSVESLAERAGMSPSSFFAHFKRMTHTTPIQYRTQLRLIEARRLMVAHGLDAAEAGFRVGYGSPSQFSRLYQRQFDAAPAADAARIRAGQVQPAAKFPTPTTGERSDEQGRVH
ncbi:MAG: AraC family transcriptional regulator [Myxococcota bacterium]